MQSLSLFLFVGLRGSKHGPGDHLQNFVQEEHWEREAQHGSPLVQVKRLKLKQARKCGHVENNKMQGHGQHVGQNEVHVSPWRHGQQALVFADTVQGVEELNGDENRECNGHGAVVLKHVAPDTSKLCIAREVRVRKILGSARHKVAQLPVRKARAISVGDKPPRSAANSGSTNIQANGHVAEKQPATDELFLGVARGASHDVQVRRVEPKGRCRQTIRHQVDPQQLHGNEGFWKAKGCREKNADDFANVGRNQVADKLLCVVVNGAALFDSRHDGGKVIVSKHHVRGALCDGSARAHGNTDVSLFQSGCIIDTIARHGGDGTHALQVLDNLAFVCWLDTGKEACPANSFLLQPDQRLGVRRKCVELSAVVRQTFHILVFAKHPNAPADGHGRVLEITSDDNNTNACTAARLNGNLDLLTRGVQHARHPNKSQVLLDALVSLWADGPLAQLVCSVWLVECGKTQATQGARSRAVVVDGCLNLFSQALGQGHNIASFKTDLLAASQHLFWGTLDKKLGFFGLCVGAVHRHGLAVAGKLKCKVLVPCLANVRVACKGTLLVRKALDLRVCDVELFDKHNQGGLGGFADFDVLALVAVQA
eukprot:m.387384 g.387384  ORF g.387384 m.387384 type:complete len:597 (-) comp20066_c2_seq5:2324-4114(-)